MHLLDNTILQNGKYRIVRYIAGGGFGCTYEGEHVLLRKRVAIKEFFVKDFCNREETTKHVTVGTHSKVALVEKLQKKFLEEARSICNYNHPGIVHVSDVFEENGTAYFVMDYIDGPSLNQILKTEGSLPEDRAVRYICLVADALKEVHRDKRLHLDIKPANIMINSLDNPVLIDFGASKQYDEAGGENTSTLLGKTPGFAPPEQMGNSVIRFNPATDIYSLGATLYKLLTGQTPPDSVQLMSGEGLPPLPEGTTPQVEKAIRKAMRIKKSERPQTIDEFLAIFDEEIPAENPATAPIPPMSPTGDEATQYGGPSQAPAAGNPDDDATQYGGQQDGMPPMPPMGNGMAPQGPGMPPPPPGMGGQEQYPMYDYEKPKKKSNIGIIIIVFLICFLGAGAAVYFLGGSSDSTSAASDTTATGEPITMANDTITFTNSKGVTYRYVGQMVNDEPDGEGYAVYPDGIYEGKFQKGLRHGKGNYTTNDGGNHFEGVFENDEYSSGQITLEDGSYYYGNFRNNQPWDGKWYTAENEVEYEIHGGRAVQR